MSAELVVPDEDEIRPVGRLCAKRLRKFSIGIVSCMSRCECCSNKLSEIGFTLRSWHDLMPHGKWLKWCEDNIPEINERTVRRYIQLWDNHEWLEARFKSDTVSDLPELPGIKEALSLIQEKNRKEREADRPPKAPGPGHRSRSTVGVSSSMPTREKP